MDPRARYYRRMRRLRRSAGRWSVVGAGLLGAAAVLTPDAGRLLIGAGREVVMLPVQGGEPIARSTYDTPVRGLALSNDGTRLYVGQADGVVRQKLTDRPELTGDLAPTRTVVGGLRLVRRVVGPGR